MLNAVLNMEHGKARQGRTGQGRRTARQDTAGQGRVGQGRAGQGKVCVKLTGPVVPTWSSSFSGLTNSTSCSTTRAVACLVSAG